MPSTILDFAVFRDIFTTEARRSRAPDENRVQKYLDFEAALARAQARLGIIPKGAAAEIVRHCSADKIDMAKRGSDRADRLSGAPRRAAAGEALQRRAWRVVALGRNHPGHHRHRHHHADPRGACHHRKGYRRHLRRAGRRSPGNTATRRWRDAAIFNRRCRSPSVTRWRPCSPPSNAISNG